MKKRIAIDMDEVMANLMAKFLVTYEERYGKKLTKADYWGKKIYEVDGVYEMRKVIFEKGYFADLPVMKDAQTVIKELQEHYDIFVVTAAQEFKFSFEDKYDWLQEHFPFIHWKNFVFCGDKSIIKADYLIDDHPHNLETFAGKGLLFTASHNTTEERFTRLNNWQEVKAFFEQERAKQPA